MPTLGYNNSVVNRYYVPQVEPLWCWAASVEMALKVHGINFSKEQIAAICHGLDHASAPIVKPGRVDDVHRFLNGGYFNDDGHHYYISATHYDGLPTATIVKECVGKSPERPVLFWFLPEGQELGHVIVCTGVEIDATPAGNICMFHVMDPNDPKVKSYTCAEICNRIQHTWTVTDVKKSIAPVRPALQH